MALPAFRFSLEPKRVEASAERDEVLAQLRGLEFERDGARARLVQALCAVRKASQRMRAELDEQRVRPLGLVDAREWSWSCQYVEQLRGLQLQCERSSARRREELTLAELKVENKRAELAEQQERLDVLERACEREHAAHRRACERDEERRRDDEAPLRWALEERTRVERHL